MGLYQGDYQTTVAGHPLTFAFDYAAQDALRTLLGKQWQQAVNVAMVEQDAKVLADVAAIGLRKHQPEITVQVLMEWSPPIVQLVMAVASGLRVAWHGPGALEPDKEAPEPEGKQNGSEAGSPLATHFLKILRWASASGSRRASSGGSAPLN